MVFYLHSLVALVQTGIRSTSRVGLKFEELKRADSRTPLEEPLRAADVQTVQLHVQATHTPVLYLYFERSKL